MLLILTLVFSLSVRAQQSCKDIFEAPPDTPSGSFQELVYAFQLLRQSDPRLEKLLDGESGFCGFACAVNVVHAFTDYLGYNSKITEYKPFRRLERMISIWERATGEAAGDGVDLVSLAAIIKIHNAERDPFVIRTRVTHSSSENSINPPANGLVILGVQTGLEAGHALISLRVDKQNKKVLIADPNYPDHLEWIGYRTYVDGEGKSWLKLDLPKEEFGYDPLVGFISEQMLLTIEPR